MLGLTVENAHLLRQALLNAALSEEAVVTEQDNYGQRYLIDFTMNGPAGQQVMIRSGWIVRDGEHFPRLTTCYVLLAKE
jgi:hypothetical protein